MRGLEFAQYYTRTVLDVGPHVLSVNEEEHFQFLQSKQNYHSLSTLITYDLELSRRGMFYFPIYKY